MARSRSSRSSKPRQSRSSPGPSLLSCPVQRLLPGLAGLVLLGLAGLVVPAGQAGEITGSAGGLSLGTRVNGQMGGSCGAGDCGIDGGTKAGPNLFHRFASFDTRGGIRSVLFDTQGQRTLVVGVVNPLGSFLDKPIGFSSPASLIWLSPGGVHLGGGVGFVNIPSLQLSTATGLRVGGGMFDVMRTTAAQAAQLSGEPLAGRAGLVSDPASLAAASLSANGDVTLSSGLLTVDHELLLDAQGGHVLLQGGQIRVPGGSVELAGKSVTVAPATGVSVGGASGGGTIRAQAGSGGLEVAGSLEARAEAPAAAGGRIELSGSTVALRGARLEASGPAGGGMVLVGGGLQGRDAAVPNAQATLVDGASTIRADATATGRGGTVVVWADRATRVDGAISARGGAAGGDGGFVETSGRQQLAVSQAPDASAPWGKGGTWLLDPNNLTVNATGPDFNISGENIGFSADYFTSGDNAVIATTTITSALNTGTSVFLSTSAGGLQAGDITVAAPITKAEGLDSIPTLTLIAHNNININADITSTAGRLGLTLTPDSDASGSGVSTLASGVTLDLNGGTALLNGTSSLAGTVSVGTLSATGGNTTLESSGTLTAAQINLTGGTLTANGPLTTRTYTQSGGTLSGSGNVTVSGASTLSGGSLSGSGEFFTESSTALSGTLTLNGKTWVNWSGGGIGPALVTQSGEAQVVLTNGSIINNQGSWSIEGSNATPIVSSNFNNSFTNNLGGTLTKAVSSAKDVTLALDGSFNNIGTVNVNEGTLTIPTGGLETGTYNVISGATLTFAGGTRDFSASSNIAGAGSLNVSGGTVNYAGTSFDLSINGSVNVNGGAFYINTDQTIANPFTLTSGTLGGSGNVTLTGGSSLSGGIITGTGLLITDSNTNVTGTVAFGNKTWNNLSGRTVTISGASQLILDSANTLNNAGTFSIEGSNSTPVQGVNFNNVFNNSGTLTKAVGSVASATLNLDGSFNNSGVVNVNEGTLVIPSGGEDSGVYNVPSGSTLNLNGGNGGSGGILSFWLFTASSNIAGAGSLNVSGGNVIYSGTVFDLGTFGSVTVNGGTFNVNTDQTFANPFTLSSGTLGGSGNVTVTGGSSLSGGIITGTGLLITDSNTNVTGTVAFGNKTWNNLSGRTVTISGASQLILDSANTLNNAGTFSIEGSNSTPVQGVNFNNVFNNSGTLTKAVGSVASATLNLDGSFNNSGVVNVNEGTLQLNNFPTNGGTLNIASGAVLSTNGNNLTNAATTGVIRGEGTLNLGGLTLTNAGTISPGTPSLSPGLPGTAGTLTINGNLALEPTSLLEIDLLGSVSFPIANDQLVVNGNATLRGTLTASTGSFYVPPVGTTVDIITATSFNNFGFTTINLPAGFSGNVATPPAPASPTFRLSKAACLGVCWDGGGGSSNRFWSTAANWSLDTLPGVSDSVYLNMPGGASVLLNDTRTIAALFSDIGNDLAIISGGSLTLTGAATASDLQGSLVIAGGNLTVDGLGSTLNVLQFVTASPGSPGIPPGTLGGSGTVTVTGGSSLSGGTFSGTGAFITDSATTVSGSIAVEKPWTNAATRTLSQTGSAQVFVGSGNTITNAGIWNLDGSAAIPIASNNGLGTFTNAAGGTLNKNTASVVSLNPNNGFNNNGTLNVVGGGLTIPGGGSDQGLYSVASGTTLNFTGGTRSLDAAANISGNGAMVVDGATLNYGGNVFGFTGAITLSSGALNFNTNQSITGAYTQTGGTLGGLGTVTVTGGSSLSGGTFSGTGAFITDSATTVSGSIAVEKPWTNAATRTLSQTGSAQVFVGSGNTITNAGIWNLDGSAAIPIASNNGLGTFTNAAGGTLNKNTASVVSLNPNNGFNNNGTLNVVGGGLLVGSSFAQAGTIAVAAGTSFEKFGGFTNAPGGVIEGAGVVSVGFGNTLTNAGTISPGTPSLSPGIPGTVGTLTINGDLALTSTSQLFIDLEGGEGAFDKLVVNGNASLGGTLTASLAPGYTPPVGSTFDIVTATSFSGGSTSLPSGSFTTTNLPTDFSGTTVTPPSPANPTYRLSKGAPCAGVCWDGGGGDNLWSTATNWTLDTLPGLSDTAYLNLLGGASVLLDNSQTIAALFSDAGNNLTIASGGSLTLLGTGSGDSRLDGSLTLQAGGSLSLNGTGLQAVQGLLNEGLVVINSHQSPGQGDAYIRIPSDQTFENRGRLDLNFTQSFGGWSLLSNPEGQDGIFTNSGRVNLNSGSTAWEIAFNNTAAGQVTLASNSVLSVQNGQTLAGTFQLGAGSTLWFSERHGADATFQAATIQGPGVIQVLGSLPRVRVDAATQFQSATDQAAGLPGLLLGSGGSVLLDGAARWSTYSQSGGFLGGSGTLEVLRSYERSGGSVAPTLAAVTINQASGDLRVADLDVAGPLSLTAEAGGLNLAGFLAADRIQAFGSTGLSLESGTVLEATSPSGVAVVLQAGNGAFANQAGSTALSVAMGATWQVYSASPLTPQENLGSLGYNFKQYGKSFTDTTPVAGSGNGLFYAFTPILEASLSGSTSKVYDGSLTAVVDPAQVKFSGVLPGDAVSLGATGPAFYDSRDVGSGKLVTLTGVGVATASEGSIPVYGYRVAGGSASGPIGVITPATVFGGFNAADKTFDGSTTATILNRLLSGAVPGDQVALVGGSASFITPDVGTIKPVFGTGFQLAGLDRGNYTLFESGLITVASILEAPPPPTTPTQPLPPSFPIFPVTPVDPLPEEIVGGSPDRSPFPEAGLGRSILNLSSASDLGWLFNGSDLPEPEPAARARAGAAAAPAAPAALPGASSTVLDLADPAEAYSNAERKAPAIAEQLGLGRQKEDQAAPPSSLSLQEWMQRNTAAVRQGAVTP